MPGLIWGVLLSFSTNLITYFPQVKSQKVLDMALDAHNTAVNNPEKFSAIMDPM